MRIYVIHKSRKIQTKRNAHSLQWFKLAKIFGEKDALQSSGPEKEAQIDDDLL